jgi:hypothetical protein
MQAELHHVQVTKGCVKSARIAELFGRFHKAKIVFLMLVHCGKDSIVAILFKSTDSSIVVTKIIGSWPP